MTVHEYADMLKKVLRELPEPLISNTLVPVFDAVSKLNASDEDVVRRSPSLRRTGGRHRH